MAEAVEQQAIFNGLTAFELKLFGVEGRKLANLFLGIPFHRES
jgi:hypothetical protein